MRFSACAGSLFLQVFFVWCLSPGVADFVKALRSENPVGAVFFYISVNFRAGRNQRTQSARPRAGGETKRVANLIASIVEFFFLRVHEVWQNERQVFSSSRVLSLCSVLAQSRHRMCVRLLSTNISKFSRGSTIVPQQKNKCPRSITARDKYFLFPRWSTILPQKLQARISV